MVKRSTDQNLRSRNFDARNVKIETGAVVSSRRGLSGIERGSRNLLSVESKKVSVREETNADSDTRVMIVQKRHRKPLYPLSHQHQEVAVCREKGSGKFNRQPCKNFLKGVCSKLPGDYWHPPECQF